MKIQSEKYKKERNKLLDINYEFVWLHIYIYDFFHQNKILNNNDTKCLRGYYLCDAPVKKITDEFESGMKIFIKTIDDKILTLEMRHSNKIRDVKMKIEEKTKLSLDEQNLFFQGEILSDDNKTISEYQICDRSEISIVGRLKGGTENYFPGREDEVQIRDRSVFRGFARVSKGKPKIISQIEMFEDDKISKGESINDYSAKLRERMFAKTAEQNCEIQKQNMQERRRLFFQNETIDKYEICEKPMRRTKNEICNDDKIFQIYKTSMKTCLTRMREDIQIFVKTKYGITLPLTVQNSDKIIYVKCKIQEKTGLHPDGQQLVYQSGILNDDKTIEEYKICDQSVINIDDKPKNKIQILIKISNKSIIPISIDPRSKIFELKLKIEKQTGLQIVNSDISGIIDLVFVNEILDDDKLLIEYNIEDGFVVSIDNRQFFSFMQAIKSGLFESVQSLYDDKFHEMQNECKPSPLHYACKQHNADIVKFLIRKKFKVNSFDSEYNMPIHYACINNHVKILETLIENKCDIEVCDAYGMKPIHLACLSGNFRNVKLLIENGCKLESKDYLGRQPIHLACLAGNIDIVKLLMQKVSELEVIDKTNKSPLIIAQNENHTDIIKIINEEKLSRMMIESIIKALDLKCEKSCDHKFCLTSLRNKTFNKGKKIGHGSFGAVYINQISQSSHQIVIKKISKNEISSDLIEGNINKFIDKINHKRIIKYFGAIRKDENSFIFMEFMPGGSLRSKISKNQPMACYKVLRYTKQILKGLRFLHGNEIIHRDIKPDHILLENDENVKLTDLGLGKSLDNTEGRKTLAKTFCGTVNYMAPEIINGEMYSYGVDIWSLGVTMIEMATGKTPYSEFVPEAVLFKIGTTKTIPYQLPESSTIEMKNLIDQMLIAEPRQRPNAMDLIKSLDEIK